MIQSDTEDFQPSQPKVYTSRRQYLVTYSKADMSKFPTRDSFGEVVVSCFNASWKVVVEYWACCLEEHEHTSGYHYHVSVKLSGPKRWDAVKKNLSKNYGMIVNFSEVHECYYSAYQYVCKNDPRVFKSHKHPDLREIGSPVTKRCMKAYRQKCQKRKQNNTNKNNTEHNQNNEHNTQNSEHNSNKQTKVRRLSNLDVSEFLVTNQIKSETELFAKACELSRSPISQITA